MRREACFGGATRSTSPNCQNRQGARVPDDADCQNGGGRLGSPRAIGRRLSRPGRISSRDDAGLPYKSRRRSVGFPGLLSQHYHFVVEAVAQEIDLRANSEQAIGVNLLQAKRKKTGAVDQIL